ncbi:DUF5709 domain-containing protein [Nonomuraea glycinis]|uniref:DUF5709 domain-containing protein n=1 Tax=Nonomuraea glycinis TaxID=2047744 RepID=A0A918A8C2_9ACTN|nr:DUF5709 domain-containing protein [Nonomuraea glycinis]MCA2179380.1 DUF5709 domain-containing protein [Nonomuraea glycinis]GGP09818.1 hypothetical protein GCM10012278_46990 [Nonomuraea glycinis]
MSELPPDRFGYSDEQDIEVSEWTDDQGMNHEIREDDPQHVDTLDERLRREAPERTRVRRPGHRLTQPDEGLEPDSEGRELGQDWGADGGDLSSEERAIRIERDDEMG